MIRLSKPIENIQSHYTVVVIGSGYGGGIAASRLARAGQSVCVLERGKEYQAGEYPNAETSAISEFQIDLPDRHIGSATGLYDLRVNDEINVFVGCGLGGTSLVNANVSLRVEPRVFDSPCWPQELRNTVHSLVEDGYRRAVEMLRPTPYPAALPALRKLEALEKSASYLGKAFYRVPINVTFTEGVNHVGVQQQACTLCGDCVSGCNYAAKNTVLMNYLPDAKNHDADIYTQVSVRRISRQNGNWLVHYQLTDAGREKFDAPPMFVSADVIILAAGTLGSTEILLRSKAGGLNLSDKLGHNFSGNGDVLGFGYNNDIEINGIGFGDRAPTKGYPVGPTITGIIDMRNQPELNEGMVVQEGAIPGGASKFLPEILAMAAALVGKDTDRSFVDFVKELFRKLVSLVRRSRHGAVRNTQTYLVNTHDDGEGRMYLQDDRLRIDWPGVGTQPRFKRVNAFLEQATKALGGTWVKNPIYSRLMGHDLITVHPLGGCVMAENAENGVANHKGQVFSGSHGETVYDSLYVCDGSIIPRSLGVNPLLTISALAERNCTLLAKDRGWEINYDLPSSSSKPSEPRRLGIQFTESMKGYVSTKVTDDFEKASQQAQQDNSPLEFVLTIISDDLNEMLEDPKHQARMVGTVVAPALSTHPITVNEGEFNLFIKDSDQQNTRQMRYRMRLTSQEGHVYYFSGFKQIRDDPGFDIWSDTTTLYVTIFDGDSMDGPVLGKGILRIGPDDFRRQLTTIRVNNSDNTKQRLKATARFGRFFAGELWKTYGIG